MKPSEVRELTDADISARIAELEEERFRLKFRAATETLEDPLRLRFIRRDIARLHTILRERALAAGAPRRGRKNAAAAARRAAAEGAGSARGGGGTATKTGAAKRATPAAKKRAGSTTGAKRAGAR
jgi:large subunit ribosomal protein L29